MQAAALVDTKFVCHITMDSIAPLHSMQQNDTR
jgi:hypothetical protein